jgi:hypothetical protein
MKIRKALQDRYSGPYRIVRKVSPITYVVNIFGKEFYIAARNMKKFSSSQFDTKEAKKDKRLWKISSKLDILTW